MKFKVKWLVHFFKIFNVLYMYTHMSCLAFTLHTRQKRMSSLPIILNKVDLFFQGNLQYANQCFFNYNLFKS